MENMTNIYFIGSVGSMAVKIGKSNNPEKRLAELQTGHPHKLVLYAVVENVTPDYEMKLHRILAHIRKEGEWFELNDELIDFMINRTVETSYPFKTNNTIKLKPELDESDKCVKTSKKNLSPFQQGKLMAKLIEGDKSLRSKLERRGVHVIRSGAVWIFLDHQTDHKIILQDHYLGTDTIISDEILDKWNEKWILKTMEDSEKWEKIKFSIGYSHITQYKDDCPTVYTNTTSAPGVEGQVIIYKGGIYDANCVTE